MSHPIRLTALCTALLFGVLADAQTLRATELGIQGTRFTVDGEPTFLLGISYYGALGASKASIQRDLDEMQKVGFNWFRIWATWAAFDNDLSVVDDRGNLREPPISKLAWLVEECDRRGMIVDVSFSRGGRVAGPPRLAARADYRRAIENVVSRLKPFRNWYLDLGNERNIRDPRFVAFDELANLRQTVRRIDPERLITASHAGDINRDDLAQYLDTVRVDFISPHRPRNAKSAGQTQNRSKEYLGAMSQIGRQIPLHYQEPFRRGFTRGWEPTADDFLTDAKGALQGGAAGWCLHNGDERRAPQSRPRRSFDMRDKRLFDQLDEVERQAIADLHRWFSNKKW